MADGPPGAHDTTAQGIPSRIEEGMTRQDVLAAWGSPNVKVREGVGERWSYWMRDARQRIVGRAYVLFDAQGRVSEVVEREGRGSSRPETREPLTISAAPPAAGVPPTPSLEVRT